MQCEEQKSRATISELEKRAARLQKEVEELREMKTQIKESTQKWETELRENLEQLKRKLKKAQKEAELEKTTSTSLRT